MYGRYVVCVETMCHSLFASQLFLLHTLFAAWMCATLISNPSVGYGTDLFPFRAAIQMNRTPIRSGPGSMYYTTSVLHYGDEVEVYRTTDDGWCAIRPPAGSFSWILADSIRPTGQGDIAEINREAVLAQIGTHLNNARHVVQVKLNRGEHVQILQSGISEVQQENSQQSWHKISPPAGEFRWVHERFLKPNNNPVSTGATFNLDEGIKNKPAVNESANSRSGRNQLATTTLNRSEFSIEPIDPEFPGLGRQQDLIEDSLEQDNSEALQHATSDENNGNVSEPLVVSTVESATIDTIQPVGWTARTVGKRGLTDENDHPQRTLFSQRQTKLRPVKNSDKRSATKTGIGEFLRSRPLKKTINPTNLRFDAASFNRELQNIDIDLSLMVSRQTKQWELAPILKRADQVVQLADTLEQQEQARSLQQKIIHFEDIHQRYHRVALTSLTEPSSDNDGPLAHPTAPVEKPKTPDFDGSGWLMPVITRRSDVPRYALTDHQGHILQFVSPTPGLNLQRYLRKQVGIQGRSEMLPKLTKNHLTADRVVVLNQRGSWLP